MDNKKKRVYKNALSLVVLQGSNYLAPLILLPYLARIFTLNDYGVYAFVIAMTQTAYVLTDFGFNLYGTNYVARHRDNNKKISRFIGGVFLIKLILLIVASVSVIVFSLICDKYNNYTGIFAASVLIIIGQAFQFFWFFQGIEKMKFIVLNTGVGKLLLLLLTLIFVTSTDDLLKAILINGLSQVITALMSFIMVIKNGYKISLPGFNYMWKLAASSSSYFYSRIAVSFYTSFATIFVGLVMPVSQVAIFSLPDQACKAMRSLVQPIAQALYPYMSREKDTKFLHKIVAISSISSVVLGIATIYLAPHLIVFFFGDKWGECVLIFRLFVIVFIVSVPSVLLGYPMMAAIGKPKAANYSVMFGVAVYVPVLFLLWLLDLVSLVNMVLVILLTESVVLSVRLYYTRRYKIS